MDTPSRTIRSSDRRAPDAPDRASTAAVIGVWCVVWAVCGLAGPAADGVIPGRVVSVAIAAPAVASAVVFVTMRRRLPRPWPAVPASRWWSSLALAGSWVGLVVGGAVTAGADLAPARIAVAGTPIGAVLVLHVLGAFAEEIGWRGTLQRVGETLTTRGAAAVVLGVLFGVTHIGYWSHGPGFVAVFTMCAACVGVTGALVARGNLLQRMAPAVVVHTGLNLVVAAGGRSVDPWTLVEPCLVATVLVVAVSMWCDRSASARHPVTVGTARRTQAPDAPSSEPGSQDRPGSVQP